ncbi:hypothetical protein [Streptomyces syringium]|uniref:hypothetical protein n=1 Tax=Streptomyces syringium TaxID=76729 RepID=UPI0033AAF71B
MEEIVREGMEAWDSLLFRSEFWTPWLCKIRTCQKNGKLTANRSQLIESTLREAGVLPSEEECPEFSETL